MTQIKSINDIKKLKKRSSLPDSYKKVITKYFYQLHEALGNGIKLKDFILEPHGHIIILEKNDESLAIPLKIKRQYSQILNLIYQVKDFLITIIGVDINVYRK